MTVGYYGVLVLGAIALLGSLVLPLTAKKPQPVRIASDRPRRPRTY